MTGFDLKLASWQPFFSAQLGAGAALLGLLFVGLSLNLARILADPNLPRRAEISLAVLALQIIVCSIMLVPDQTQRMAGIETLLVAGTVWLAATAMNLRILRGAQAAVRPKLLQNLLLLQVTVLPYLIGAAMLVAGRPGALHLLALGIVLSFLKAGMDAWVLVVEINR